MRNNEIRETLAKVMHDVRNYVEFEPSLRLLEDKKVHKNFTGTDDKNTGFNLP